MGATTPDAISYPDETTKVGPIRTVLATLASSVQTAISARATDLQNWINAEYALPSPQSVVSSTTPLAITATTFTNVGSIPTVSLTLARPAWVQCTVGAWVNSTTGDVRAGINLTGATVQGPNEPAWGAVLYQNGVNYSNLSASKVVQIGAGTTTFAVQAYQVGGGVKQLNYMFMQITPLRWATAPVLGA